MGAHDGSCASTHHGLSHSQWESRAGRMTKTASSNKVDSGLSELQRKMNALRKIDYTKQRQVISEKAPYVEKTARKKDSEPTKYPVGKSTAIGAAIGAGRRRGRIDKSKNKEASVHPNFIAYMEKVAMGNLGKGALIATGVTGAGAAGAAGGHHYGKKKGRKEGARYGYGVGHQAGHRHSAAQVRQAIMRIRQSQMARIQGAQSKRKKK